MSQGAVHVVNRIKSDSVSTLNTNNGSGNAFGAVRVSNPKTIFDSKQTVSSGIGAFWDTELNGDGAIVYDATESCSDFAVTNNGDFAIKQTKQHFNYQPGKGQRILMTGILEPENGTTKMIGYIQGSTTTPFATNDGLCFETIDTDMYVSIYKDGGTTKRTIQADWNIDKLDGTGASGITADWSQCQIFDIKFEWLGVGRVVFSVNIDGMNCDVHEYNHANNSTNVYMRSPNQPVRYEIRSTGSAGTLKQICCSVQSEGGQEATGLVAAVDTDGTTISISTTLEMILAVRLKSDQLDATVMIEKINVLSTSNANFRWALCFNPVIVGAPVWVDVPGSAIQRWDGDGTTDTTEIITMDSGFVSNNADVVSTFTKTNLMLGSDINGDRDVIALCVQTTSGNDSFAGGLTLRQLI